MSAAESGFLDLRLLCSVSLLSLFFSISLAVVGLVWDGLGWFGLVWLSFFLYSSLLFSSFLFSSLLFSSLLFSSLLFSPLPQPPPLSIYPSATPGQYTIPSYTSTHPSPPLCRFIVVSQSIKQAGRQVGVCIYLSRLGNLRMPNLHAEKNTPSPQPHTHTHLLHPLLTLSVTPAASGMRGGAMTDPKRCLMSRLRGLRAGRGGEDVVTQKGEVPRSFFDESPRDVSDSFDFRTSVCRYHCQTPWARRE